MEVSDGNSPLFQGKSIGERLEFGHIEVEGSKYTYIYLVVEWLRFMVAMHPRSWLQWVFHSPENSSKLKKTLLDANADKDDSCLGGSRCSFFPKGSALLVQKFRQPSEVKNRLQHAEIFLECETWNSILTHVETQGVVVAVWKPKIPKRNGQSVNHALLLFIFQEFFF